MPKRSLKRKNQKLTWVDVTSHKFKEFINNMKKNFRLTQSDQAGTIGWGRVPYIKKQKHMEHGQYIINAEFFRNARAFLTLGKSHNKIDGSKVALFDVEVPDTVFDGDREHSNTNEKFFANTISTQKKRKILQPIKHSTLLRNDVSSERIISENENVQYHMATQGEKVKESLLRNDEILQKIVGKLQSIMKKNDMHKKKLISMENSSLHLHSGIESRSMALESGEAKAQRQIENVLRKTQPKAPYREFGVVYDTEDKQFMHKRKVVRIKV